MATVGNAINETPEALGTAIGHGRSVAVDIAGGSDIADRTADNADEAAGAAGQQRERVAEVTDPVRTFADRAGTLRTDLGDFRRTADRTERVVAATD